MHRVFDGIDRQRCPDCVQPGNQPCHPDYCAMRGWSNRLSGRQPVRLQPDRDRTRAELDRLGVPHNLTDRAKEPT